MNILFLLPAEGSSGNSVQWRVGRIYEALVARGEPCRLARILDFAQNTLQEDLAWADLIIWCRTIYPEVVGPLLSALARGKRVLLDLDDAYPLMPILTTGYDYWKLGMAQGKKLPYDPQALLKHILKLVTACTCPTQLLADYYHQLTGVQALVVPNYPDTSRYKVAPACSPPNSIFWTGSKSHFSGLRFSPAIDAWNRYNRYHKGTKAVIYGDERLLTLVKGASSIAYTHPDQYPDTLIGCGQVGLAPLSGQYDLYRSPIKLMDLTFSGIPWVASATGPYLGWEGRGGLLVGNTQRDWYHGLEEVMGNYLHYREEALAWRETNLRTWDIRQHVDEILQIWKGEADVPIGEVPGKEGVVDVVSGGALQVC